MLFEKGYDSAGCARGLIGGFFHARQEEVEPSLPVPFGPNAILAAERARLQTQERQQAREREKVAERFRTIAARREAGAQGYGDRSNDWRATPEALRTAVDAYNGANQHTKGSLHRADPARTQMARAVGQLIDDRELVLQRDRELSR